MNYNYKFVSDICFWTFGYAIFFIFIHIEFYRQLYVSTHENLNNTKFLSLFLDFHERKSQPPGCTRNARFALEVVHPANADLSVRREASHQFSENSPDWGFKEFLTLARFSSDFKLHNKVTINVEVQVLTDIENTLVSLHVATDANLRQGGELFAEKEFRVKRFSTLQEFKTIAKDHFSIPADQQVYWLCFFKGGQYKPDKQIFQFDECVPLDDVALLNRGYGFPLHLFLQVSAVPVSLPRFAPRDFPKLVFFKHYDPLQELVNYIGCVSVPNSMKLSSLIPLMNGMVGNLPTTSLWVFQENRPTVVNPLGLQKRNYFHCGDVLIFQELLEFQQQLLLSLPTVEDYYNEV